VSTLRRVQPVILVHGGAGARAPELAARAAAIERALGEALRRGGAALDRGGDALDAAQAAVMCMEDEADFLNAGRGSVLCSDGGVEMSASLMRGRDRAAGAMALLRTSRSPIAGARAVLERSPHVLLAGPAADALADAAGIEQRPPAYFITERQQRRLVQDGRGTVGAVALDGAGGLAAATSTGGARGQAAGRIGDSPLIGAGTWADGRVAVSCTGDGEAFIRAAAAHQLAGRVVAGEALAAAAAATLDDVASLGARGGLIALGADGAVAMPFSAEAMARGVWRAGAEVEVHAA